jgi:hypothetical protein
MISYLFFLVKVLDPGQEEGSVGSNKNPKGFPMQGYPLLICPCKATLIED